MKGVGWLTGEVASMDCEVCEIVQANGAGSNDTAREISFCSHRYGDSFTYQIPSPKTVKMPSFNCLGICSFHN